VHGYCFVLPPLQVLFSLFSFLEQGWTKKGRRTGC